MMVVTVVFGQRGFPVHRPPPPGFTQIYWSWQSRFVLQAENKNKVRLESL